MGLFQTQKPHSAGKVMIPPGAKLNETVLDTLNHIAEMVGATLGPGGQQVLIERSEMNMKPIITKDGVTVIKSLGYHDSVRQVILESVRDAAIRTASEAGDGTTTATILSNAIAQRTHAEVKLKPMLSPQRIVRDMQALIPGILSRLSDYKLKVDGTNYTEVLHRVASLSANGDSDLADAILKAIDLVGDEGNMTILEVPGPSRYEVSKISGYAMETGYENSVKQHAQGFINDEKTGTQVVLKNPIVLLFDGVIQDSSQIVDALEKLALYWNEINAHDRNVVLVAHGFGDHLIGDMHMNWNAGKIKIFPLITRMDVIENWQTATLHDLAAYTGSVVFNPVTKPLIEMDPAALVNSNLVTYFECSRFRSSFIAKEDPFAIEMRLEELKAQKKNPDSDYHRNDLEVRIGKLTNGIAKLTIYGASAGETREKRDRADDAWCAVRGATKDGALPGGGYALVRLAADLTAASLKLTGTKEIAAKILAAALKEPVRILYKNYGYNVAEAEQALVDLLKDDSKTYNVAEQAWVHKNDLLDSLPAVSEAIRNSVSIASLIGTLGGIVAFKRDADVDGEEQRFQRRFERSLGEE